MPGSPTGTPLDRRLRMRSTILLASLLVASASTTAAADTAVDKFGLVFHLRPHTPELKEWKWTPSLRIRLSGPITSSAQLVVDYTFPNGKAWKSVTCENVGQIPANEFLTVNDCGHTLDDKDATALTGQFGFTIKMTDELAGASKTLFKGKFTVGRQVYNPSKAPDRNKQFYYYVDQDWRLPIAYAGVHYGDVKNMLKVETWIKGPIPDTSKMRGYLFFNGKQVSEESASYILAATPPEIKAWEYHQITIKFPAMVDKPEAEGVDGWKLYENPGEYEFKLLRDGKLARTFKFTIGPDGRPKDVNGARASAGFDTEGAVLTTSVLGNGDGTWRAGAWKTEALFGNPPAGL